MSALPSTAYVQFGAGHLPEVNATIRLSPTSRMYCHTYPDSAPIVSIDDPPVRLSISVRDPGQVTGQDVQCARQLADLLARYVAALEQLAAATDQPGPGPDDTAGQAA
jgi:hypothetical protein